MTVVSDRLRTTIDSTTGLELTSDTQTGEVLASRKITIKKHTITADVGKQCRHPVDARTSEELAEILSVHDHWADNLLVESDKLLDLLDAGEISPGAIKVFRNILVELAGRNLWFGRLADLGTKREVADLNKIGLIRVVKQGPTLPTKVLVHPWYGWRGDLSARQIYLGQWLRIGAGD
ncbi:hypothetical protein [Pseudomonas migulae]|jgi:hypothetical protein|uniref:Uncharacterized protein n=1 Tax=Pseudomonas migulae TaxID=78543 RepID=A0ABY8MV59_9PSED|nr:hypothetical protein [Pseudomonas migulae]WGK91260.1 hypothetical protein MOQ58_03460 [Pseudomonas migulae]